MSDLNQVQLIGRLGADPETRYSAAGAAFTNINVATTDKWRDKQSGEQKEKTEWHRVVFFGRLAEIAGEYLKKGAQVYVSGKLQTRKWQDNDGNDRYTTETVANNMIMLGGKGQQQGSAAPEPNQGGFRDKPEAAQEGGTNEDIPF